MAPTVRRAAKAMTPISGSEQAARIRRAARGRLRPAGSAAVPGFTLLEILLVLAIIGVASLVVYPNITSLDGRTFNARVREAHTLLNLARRTAVVSGQPSIATFSVLPADAVELAPLSPLGVGRWDGSGIDVTFQDSADQEIAVQDSLEITFYPEGGSTGGNLLLAYQGRLASIAINPFTGRVETEFSDER